MEFQTIVYQKESGIATITLNRPDKLNVTDLSGDGGIIDDFSVALDKAGRGDDIKVLIIKGGALSTLDMTWSGFIRYMGSGMRSLVRGAPGDIKLIPLFQTLEYKL